MQNPKITIIIPVYNTEKYLRCCLDSIIAQSFTSWECICVNDGSSDNSGKILDEYAKKENRFIVIHRKNGGVSSARNIGLNMRRGEWITFVDSDDWIENETCEIAYKTAIECHADIVQWKSKRKQKINNSNDQLHIKEFNIKDDPKYFSPSMWDKLVSAELILHNKIRYPENIKLSEDRLFAFECYLYAKKCIFISKELYNYRENLSSASHSISYDMLLQEIKVVKKIEELATGYAEGTYDEVLYEQKRICKYHSLFSAVSPELELARKIFPEIDQRLLSEKRKLSLPYYFVSKNRDFIAIWIIRFYKILLKVKKFYQSKFSL